MSKSTAYTVTHAEWVSLFQWFTSGKPPTEGLHLYVRESLESIGSRIVGSTYTSVYPESDYDTAYEDLIQMWREMPIEKQKIYNECVTFLQVK